MDFNALLADVLRLRLERVDAAEVHAQGPPQAFGVVRRQTEVGLQTPVDAGIGGVVDGYAVGGTVSERRQDALFGGHGPAGAGFALRAGRFRAAAAMFSS